MKKRSILFLVLGAGVAGAILLLRNSISHQALGNILSSPAPTESAMDSFLETAPDMRGALAELWDTQKLPQRLYVLHTLRKHAESPEIWKLGRPWVLEAAQFADSEFQEEALQLLIERSDPAVLATTLSYLKSPDPEIRLAGLQRLTAQHDAKWAADFSLLLGDPDLQVQIIAAAGLKDITHQDFGTHLSADPQATGLAIAKWQSWWQENGSQYPASSAGVIAAPGDHAPGMAYDFALPDFAGRIHHLSDYKGKLVLLNFWATWCPSCGPELQTLSDLQVKHPELVVIGIDLDGVSDSDDHDAAPTAAEQEKLRLEVMTFATENKVSYTTLLDPLGKALGPYAAGSLPQNVLISPSGTITRRMVGIRSAPSWEQVISAAKKLP
ncbi:MAG TPA: redoxin domain-containing protein [Phycisphaerae bacterium]|jgi:peroxiredoxin